MLNHTGLQEHCSLHGSARSWAPEVSSELLSACRMCGLARLCRGDGPGGWFRSPISSLHILCLPLSMGQAQG